MTSPEPSCVKANTLPSAYETPNSLGKPVDADGRRDLAGRGVELDQDVVDVGAAADRIGQLVGGAVDGAVGDGDQIARERHAHAQRADLRHRRWRGGGSMRQKAPLKSATHSLPSGVVVMATLSMPTR